MTTWRYWPLPVRGVARASLLERLQLALQFAASVLRLPVTRVYRCVFNDEATSCSPVGARHAMANGIALRGNMIYVVDVLRFTVTAYEIASCLVGSEMCIRDRIWCR